MAFQPVVDTVEIDIIYALNGEFVQNSFYAKMVGGYLLADLEALAANVDARVQGTWKAQQAVEAIYVRTEVRGLALENDITASDSTSAGPGVMPSAAMPNNVTLAIKKVSGFTGRSARGRTYWIGPPRGQLDAANENLFIITYVSDVVDAVDSIRDAIGDVVPWQPVLVSRFAGGIQRDEGETFPWIGCESVNTIVDSQRGRLPS